MVRREVGRRQRARDVGRGEKQLRPELGDLGARLVELAEPLARVEQEMAAVMEAAIRDFPMSGTSRIYVVRPMVEQIVGDLGPILIVVLSAAGVLLVLACVNVTNLLLARGAARAREMAATHRRRGSAGREGKR